VLVLSYEFMKPMTPGLHLTLARWVQKGGMLIYVGADTDPFHQARDWWNQGSTRYDSPAGHLFETLGLGRKLEAGTYACQQGQVIVERRHPAFFSRSSENADRLRKLVQDCVESAGGQFVESNCLRLRRGPYVIAAVLDESVNRQPLQLTGSFVDLLDATLDVHHNVQIRPGQQAWLLDLDHVHGTRPLLLAAAGRVESWNVSDDYLEYAISSPEGVLARTRILLEKSPQAVLVNGKPTDAIQWDDASDTLLLSHTGRPKPVTVRIQGL
jgi:hypothetical protein